MTIIEQRRRYAFIHVPKTAGQSIRVALGREKERAIGHHARRCEIPDAGSYFTFGFVRNPWDRMASLYTFMCAKTMRASDLFDQDELRRIGFKRWLMEWDFPAAIYRQHKHVRQLGLRKPQLWWLDGCDFIGRFESLPRDFDLICVQIGIAKRVVPRINRTERPSYRELYDQEMIEAVGEWSRPDIERFEYEF